VRYSRAPVPNPTDLESTRANINGIPISAAAGVSIEGIPAGKIPIREELLEMLQLLELVRQSKVCCCGEILDTGGAKAGAAEASAAEAKTGTPNGYHDAECLNAEGSCQ
jgi:hypothetical protein